MASYFQTSRQKSLVLYLFYTSYNKLKSVYVHLYKKFWEFDLKVSPTVKFRNFSAKPLFNHSLLFNTVPVYS